MRLLKSMSQKQKEAVRRHPLRQKIRMYMLSAIGVVLLVAVGGKEMMLQAEIHSSKASIELYEPRSLETVGLSMARILATPEECLEDNPEFCGVEGGCQTEEDIEGACCRGVLLANISDATECITKGGDECPFEDLCIAEIVPGSGVGAECFAQFEKDFGVVFYVFLLLYLFLGLAIICDDYFSFALDRLGDELGLSSDVKGATFAAIGSSAPELFVSLADNVISNPPKSVGVGTIVGSAIFNILVIIGLSGIAAGDLQLDWKPLVRDSFFYILSILGLIGVAITDDEAENYEGFILLVFYGLYLWFMIHNQANMARIEAVFGKKTVKEVEEKEESKDLEVKKVEPEDQLTAMEDQAEGVAAEKTDEDDSSQPEARKRRSSQIVNLGQGVLMVAPKDPEAGFTDEDIYLEWNTKEYFSCFSPPSSPLAFAYYVLVFPLNLIFRFSVPDARYDVFGTDKQGSEGGVIHNRMSTYWAEFAMCIVWIAILSHLLVFSAAKFGCLVGIEPSVMGLTVLAAGTSVPDAITSVILARQGEGNAAVANSIGSNVFDILIGLGLPWFIAGFVYDGSAVATDDLAVAIGFLFGVLLVLLVALFITGFRLNKYLGVSLILMYVGYVIFELARA